MSAASVDVSPCYALSTETHQIQKKLSRLSWYLSLLAYYISLQVLYLTKFVTDAVNWYDISGSSTSILAEIWQLSSIKQIDTGRRRSPTFRAAQYDVFMSRVFIAVIFHATPRASNHHCECIHHLFPLSHPLSGYNVLVNAVFCDKSKWIGIEYFYPK